MMRSDIAPDGTFPAVGPLDETVDRVRGPTGGHLILQYGDYQCPYSRAAYRGIQRLESAWVAACASPSATSR
jgi:hypothetical protein